jgi:hypothetical protein
MAVSRVKTSSILQGFPKSRSMLAGNAAYDPAATWLIQRITATGSETSITFSSIPSTYKHLQIRNIAKSTNTADGTLSVEVRFNGDTGSNYAYHELRGDGTSASTNAGATQTKIIVFNASLRESVSTSTFGVSLIDIHDYASTTKNKTVRSFSGMNKNQGTQDDRISLGSGLWMNTAAITSITLISTVSAFKAGSTFALYGMVG